jgi:hypothetical protein
MTPCSTCAWVACSSGRIFKSAISESVVDFVSEWLKTKRCAQNFHGFARSLERARYIREVLWPALFARKQVVQHRSAFGGLLAPVRIQHRVTPTLQATLNVEVGFAMTDVI